MNKKKIMSVVLSFVLVIVIAVAPIHVGALDSVFPNYNAEYQDVLPNDILSASPDDVLYIAYINHVLPRYLSLTFGDFSDVQISQGFVIYGTSDKNTRAFFVTNNGNYIGLLLVTYADGMFHSSFGLDDNANITNAITNRIPVSLNMDYGIIYVLMEYSVVSLATNELSINLDVFDSAPRESVYHLAEVVMNSVDFTAEDVNELAMGWVARNSFVSSVDLRVPFVANASCTCCRRGLCWAAAVVSVGRFMNPRVGQATNAVGLFNALNNSYPGTPVGTSSWYLRGLNHFSLRGSYVRSGMNFLTLQSNLNAQRPIIFNMMCIDWVVGHAIVLHMLQSSFESTIYGFVDSNFAGTRWIHVSGPNQNINNSSFRYVAGRTFTTWHSSVVAYYTGF